MLAREIIGRASPANTDVDAAAPSDLFVSEIAAKHSPGDGGAGECFLLIAIVLGQRKASVLSG